MAFTNGAILEGAAPQERFLEGQTQALIPVETPAPPITEVLEGIQVPELGVPTPQEMEEPSEELAPAGVSTEEVAPTEEPTEEPVTPVAMFSEPAEEPDDPLCSTRREKRGR